MKNKHLVAIVCIFAFLGLCILQSNLDSLQIFVIAQVPDCPPTYGQNNPAKWAKGNFIKIKIHSAFTSTERASIIAAFNEWNNKNTINCSNVIFDTENVVIADQRPDVPEIRSHWVEFDPTTPPYNAYTNIFGNGPYAFTEVYDYLRRPGTPSTNPAWLKGLMLHEIGHTFNLKDANCDSVMASLPWQNNFIRTNDNAVIRRIYCPMATPTPTPEPPERCYVPRTAESEDKIFDDDFQMRPAEPSDCNENQQWNEETCQCDDNFPSTPIVIDTAGNGFNLTNAAAGVLFDLNGDGIREKLSWTSADSDDAWLALDRNNDGMITTGQELFGNFTPQPPPPRNGSKNGFIALAEYDKLAKGGNSDGKINQQDLIFGSLRLWRDANHDGISEQSEIFELRTLEVRAIDLDYLPSRRTDEHGNRFKYRSKVRDAQGASVGRWAWDVFLVLDQPQN